MVTMTNKKKTDNDVVKNTLNRMLGKDNQPIEKLSIMAGNFIVAYYLCKYYYEVKQQIHELILIIIVCEGFLTNCLGFRMSMFRVQITNDGIDAVSQNMNFKKWSRAQINNAEWAATILPLMVLCYIITIQNDAATDIGMVGSIGVVYTHWGTIMYLLGNLVFTGDVKYDNPAHGNRLPPFRMSGASMRYIGIFMMLYGLSNGISYPF